MRNFKIHGLASPTETTKSDDAAVSSAYPIGSVIVIVGVSLLNSSVYAWTQFIDTSEYWFATLLISACLSIVLIGLKSQLQNTVITLVLVAMASVAGMLLGSIADFGRLGVSTFIELCTPSVNLTLHQDIVRMFSIAPITHSGMLLGGLFVLAVRDITGTVNSSVPVRLARCGWHLLGMVAAMILAQAVVRSNTFNGSTSIDIDAYISPLGLMWLFMVAASLLPFFAKILKYQMTLRTSKPKGSA